MNAVPAAAAAGEQSNERGLELAEQFARHMGKLSSQSLFFFLGTLFTTAVGFFFKIYVARVLGSEGLGIYALGMTVVSFVGIFASLGLANSATRFVSVYNGTRQDARLRGFLRNGLITVTAASTLIGLAVLLARDWIAIGMYKEPGLVQYMPAFALLIPLSTLSVFASQVVQGFQDIVRRTIINSFIQYLIFILLAAAFFAFGLGLWGYILADIIATFVGLLLLAYVAWRRIPPARPSAQTLPWLAPDVVNYAFYIVAVSVLNYVASQSSQALLGMFMQAGDVGIYSVAGTLAVFVPILLSSLNSIFGPVIAELHATGERGLLLKLFQTSTKWVLALTFPLVTVMLLFAPELMGLFGAEFAPGAPVLVALVLANLVNVGVGSVGTMLFMSGNQRFELLDISVAAAVSLPLNILLIPRVGILGAGIAAGSAVAVANLMRLAQVYRVLHMQPYTWAYLRLVIPLSLALSGAVLIRLWQPAAALPGWLLILLALGLAYLVFLPSVAVLGMDEDDRLLARSVFLRLSGQAGRLSAKRGGR